MLWILYFKIVIHFLLLIGLYYNENGCLRMFLGLCKWFGLAVRNYGYRVTFSESEKHRSVRNTCFHQFELKCELLRKFKVLTILDSSVSYLIGWRDASLFYFNRITFHLFERIWIHVLRVLVNHGYQFELNCEWLKKWEVLSVLKSSVSYLNGSRDACLLHFNGTTLHLMEGIRKHGSRTSTDHGEHQNFWFHKPRLKVTFNLV